MRQPPPPLPLERTTSEPNLPSPAPTPARNGKGNGEKGRQSFSCLECRRLKLKCNRVWPCTSCEKRGCAQICPKGTMITGKGKRLILADTEELHQRISQLEVALAKSHAKHSTTPHPLLDSAYLFSPRDRERRNARRQDQLEIMPEADEILDGGLGTLTITTEGEARFVGSFAGSEYLREGEDVERERSEGQGTGLATPPASATLPVSDSRSGVGMLDSMGLGGAGNVDHLRSLLPVWESEGRYLVETYWENVNWMYQILPRPMFDNDHLIGAYDPETPANAHKLACVYFIMAIGVMFDLNRPHFDPMGEELFTLGRACLNSLGLEHASPATVEALHLCGTYVLNDKGGQGGETFWPILGVAVKLAQSLGLHRDGAAFGLSPYEVAERRQVWWEIITYDRLQALCFGRPCATRNVASDTLFPDADSTYSPDIDGYHRAKYRLVSLMEKVIDVTSLVSIQHVAKLDQEFREFKQSIAETLLPNTAVQSFPLDPSVHPHLVIHRLGIRLLIAQCRLLFNRPLFARALSENPDDPSDGRLGESLIGVFESAQEIVQLVKQLVIYHPSLIARWWFFWFHAFTASVCLAAIAIRAPSSAFASPAFSSMTIVCDIARAASPGCRAKKGLPSLLRLRQRASRALVAAGKTSPSVIKVEAGDDDLGHLDTSTKLRRIASPPSKRNSPNSITPPENSSPQSPRSIATSATLADPVYYESTGVGMMPMMGSGIVQPPPPLPSDPAPPPIQVPLVPHITQMPAWSSDLSPVLEVPPQSSVNANVISDHPFGPSWTNDQFNFSPSSFHSLNSFASFGPNASSSSPTYDQTGHGGIGMDVDMATVLGMNFAGAGAATSGMGEEFDFDMFVNQLGGGEVGLDESWS